MTKCAAERKSTLHHHRRKTEGERLPARLITSVKLEILSAEMASECVGSCNCLRQLILIPPFSRITLLALPVLHRRSLNSSEGILLRISEQWKRQQTPFHAQLGSNRDENYLVLMISLSFRFHHHILSPSFFQTFKRDCMTVLKLRFSDIG